MPSTKPLAPSASPEPRTSAVTLVAPPFAGHINPLIALGKRLARRGHTVRFVTGPRKVSLVRACGFAVDTVSREDPDAMERIADTPHPVRSNPLRLARQLRANLELLPGLRREVEEIFRSHPPDVLIADFCAPVAGWVAQESEIPWITTIPAPCALETRSGTPSYCGGWGPPTHAGHRLRDAAGRGLTRLFKKGVATVFGQHFRRLGFSVYRADGSEAAYSPQSILGLGIWELELERTWPEVFRMIGPITESPEPGPLPLALPDLDPSRLVLVTIGTHLRWAKKGLVERVAGLARSFPEHHFVISLGDLHSAAEEPILQASNLSVYPYVSYDQHLNRFAAVVHHGGTGVAYSCLRAGLPCLVWPCDYDQFDVAARLVARGAGLRIHDLGDRKSARQLEQLLSNFDRGPMQALSTALAGYDPYGACAEVVDQLTGSVHL